MPLSRAAASVLGMVHLGARSGYEILRAAELSLRFFGPLAPRQVYAELKAAEADGLLIGHDDRRGERVRRTVELTAAGRKQLLEWAATSVHAELELRDDLMVKLFFSDAGRPDSPSRALADLQERSRRMKDRFEQEIIPLAEANSTDNHASGPVLLARLHRDLHAFIEQWCAAVHAEQSGT